MSVTVTTLTGIHSLKQIFSVVNVGVYIQLRRSQLIFTSFLINGIYNKILYRDWFFACLCNTCKITWVPNYNIFIRMPVIAQFRIFGRAGASCIKPTKVRLMRGRNESTRALELVKHCCCALNCTTSAQKTKNVKKYPELANVRVFFPGGGGGGVLSEKLGGDVLHAPQN